MREIANWSSEFAATLNPSPESIPMRLDAQAVGQKYPIELMPVRKIDMELAR